MTKNLFERLRLPLVMFSAAWPIAYVLVNIAWYTVPEIGSGEPHELFWYVTLLCLLLFTVSLIQIVNGVPKLLAEAENEELITASETVCLYGDIFARMSTYVLATALSGLASYFIIMDPSAHPLVSLFAVLSISCLLAGIASALVALLPFDKRIRPESVALFGFKNPFKVS